MAEDLTKEILPIEEQKQTKKLLYKNWKLYAAALGTITVGLSVGLGVGLSVHHSHVITNNEQAITNEINGVTYTLPTITSGTTLESITNQITGDFIKTKLTGNNTTTFKTSSFKLNIITVGDDNHALTNNDLITTGTINTKINYNYGSVTNQETNLIITINASNQQIVDAINNSAYTLTITAGDTTENIINQINSNFIKTILSDNITNSFNVELFKFNKITTGTDNHTLINSDLETSGTVKAKINYDYDSMTNQNTNLTITVSPSSTEIINQINNVTTYQTNVEINSTIDDLTFMPLFIQSKLTFQYKTGFNADLFTFNKITVDGNDLQDSDLTTAKTINAKINYNYDNIENQTTNLTMIVDTNVWSDDAIINQLKNLASFTVNYDQTTATITTVEDQLKAMYIDTFTSISIQNEIKENLIISNLNRAVSGTHTPWTDDDLSNGATSGTTWYNLTFKDTLVTDAKIGYLVPVIIDSTLINYLSSANSSTRITYDKTTIKLDAIQEQMLNIVINSITNEKIQNYLKANLKIARLYTSERVDGQFVYTDVTDERLSNGETTGDYEYLLTKCILGLNEAESKVITLRLYPN